MLRALIDDHIFRQLVKDAIPLAMKLLGNPRYPHTTYKTLYEDLKRAPPAHKPEYTFDDFAFWVTFTSPPASAVSFEADVSTSNWIYDNYREEERVIKLKITTHV
jgi:hypothetical protein